jgi:hypothetical protein
MRIHRITCGPVLALVLALSWTEKGESITYDFTLIADTSGSPVPNRSSAPDDLRGHPLMPKGRWPSKAS